MSTTEIRCPYCNKPTPGLGLLWSHIQKKHPDIGAVLRGIHERAAEWEARKGGPA